jgi:hypothetical protein
MCRDLKFNIYIDCEYNQKLCEEFCFYVGNYKEFRQVLQM